AINPFLAIPGLDGRMYRGSEYEAAAGPADVCALPSGADRNSGPAEAGSDTFATVRLPFRVGARTLGRLEFRLSEFSISLDQALAAERPVLPVLPAGADGYLLRAIPETVRLRRDRRLRAFVRQRYVRHY